MTLESAGWLGARWPMRACRAYFVWRAACSAGEQEQQIWFFVEDLQRMVFNFLDDRWQFFIDWYFLYVFEWIISLIF